MGWAGGQCSCGSQLHYSKEIYAFLPVRQAWVLQQRRSTGVAEAAED